MLNPGRSRLAAERAARRKRQSGTVALGYVIRTVLSSMAGSPHRQKRELAYHMLSLLFQAS